MSHLTRSQSPAPRSSPRALGATGVVALAVLGACAPAMRAFDVPRAQSSRLLDFVAANPERAALFIIRGDSVLAAYHADRPMPLASTVKTLIAVEYAFQAASGRLLEDSPVPLASLERFYVPGTDGGAHELWLRDARKRGRIGPAGTVPLREVVRGMIRFSSNANTEHLLGVVSPDRVNARAVALGVPHPMPMYHFVSALLMLRSPLDTAALRAIPDSAWMARAAALHDSLAADATGTLRRSLTARQLTLERQRVWSDRLPTATVRAYGELAARIAARRDLPPTVQRIVEEALGVERLNPKLARLGFKGGSTAFVLTSMTYMVRTDGTRTAYALFLDGLTPRENARLQRELQFFNFVLDTDDEFRDALAALGRQAGQNAGQSVGSGGTPGLQRGTRLRIDLLPARGGWFARQAAQSIVGTFQGGQADTVLLTVRDAGAPLRIPAAAIRGVYRSRGAPSRLGTALRRGAPGALIGAAQGSISALAGEEREGRRKSASVFSGALTGAIMGTMSGLLRPAEGWDRVPMHSLLSESLPAAP